MISSFQGGFPLKKMWFVLMTALLLAGCGAEETFETVGDELVLSVMAEPREVLLTLQGETILPAMETDSGTLYLCDGYDVSVQTLDGGDLDGTLRTVTGYGREDLTVMQTGAGAYDCYEFVWTTTGEFGEQACRGMILDDGSYHYVLTAMADADEVSEFREMWNGLFESFALA